MEGSLIYFIIFTNIESLCYTPVTKSYMSIMMIIYVNKNICVYMYVCMYGSIKKSLLSFLMFSLATTLSFSLLFGHSIVSVLLFVSPWTAVCQASLSFTISQTLLKLMSIESVIPSNHLILCWPPSPPALNLSQNQGLFQ